MAMMEVSDERGGQVLPLPGTKVEVEAIAAVLASQDVAVSVYLEEQASETKLKALKQPNILHIATHGFFLPNSTMPPKDNMIGMERMTTFENPLMRSGIMLAGCEAFLKGQDIVSDVQEGEDGILTAQEALLLNFEKTSIAILSACETGLGEIHNGEGVYGLQRALQQAGVRTVIMSLWKVSDDATEQMMQHFYQYWAVEKHKKREAFRLAQLKLRESYPEPYYWGAFVIVGE
jgi:CHAT domain-containing protein